MTHRGQDKPLVRRHGEAEAKEETVYTSGVGNGRICGTCCCMAQKARQMWGGCTRQYDVAQKLHALSWSPKLGKTRVVTGPSVSRPHCLGPFGKMLKFGLRKAKKKRQHTFRSARKVSLMCPQKSLLIMIWLIGLCYNCSKLLETYPASHQLCINQITAETQKPSPSSL